MPQKKLTATVMSNLKPAPKGKRVELWDSLLPGFGVRVGETGRATFMVMYRTTDAMTGRKVQRRHTIGRYPVVKLDEAREKARDILRQAHDGEDPKAAERRATARPQSFRGLLDSYYTRLVFLPVEKGGHKRPTQTKRIFERYVAGRWEIRDPDSITGDDVSDLLSDLEIQNGGATANRVFDSLRALFKWAKGKRLAAANPCDGMKAPAPKGERDRFLSDDEIKPVWLAAEEMGNPFGTIITLLLTTGQRRTEVGGMMWDDLDLDGDKQWPGAKFDIPKWRLPKRTTKSSREHILPLSPLAVEILQEIPRTTSNYVFPARGRPENYVGGWGKWKRDLDDAIEKNADKNGTVDEHWSIHDLRRTLATGMADLRIAPHIVEMILNHSIGSGTGTGSFNKSTAAIYNRSDYFDEQRAVLDAWANHILTLLGRGEQKVIPLHG